MNFEEYKYMKKLLAFIVPFLGSLALFAQDRQFTQFYASPMTLNPALSGAFDGKYRVGGIYRDQWRGVLDQPYQTFAFGADLRLEPFAANVSKDRIGAGLLFFKDNVNTLDFSTTQIALSGAYHKALDLNSTQYLSLGLQMGLTQRNVNYENLTFQEQYNGEGKYNQPRTEKLPDNNFGYNDMALGLNYSINPVPGSAYFVGLAMHHFNSPNVAFFQGEDIPKIPLSARYSVQLAAQYPINKDHTVFMSPRILASLQGPHLTANIGTNFRFKTSKTYNMGFHVGSWVRPVKDINGFNLEAVVLMAGFEFNNILLGLSYDVNIPNLKNYKRTQNVFEISLIYLGEYDNDELLCPTF
jgi:type IX secretion system PorP/SprF family membrane protein